MKDELQKLEERVATAVSRIKELTEEREGLRTELAELRARLGTLETYERDLSAGSGETVEIWRAERSEVLAALRDAVELLRDDEAAPPL